MDKKIGFVGLGNMGTPIAINIVKAGFDLTVFDLRPEPLKELQQLGARVAGSAREVGEKCDIFHIVVVNDAQLDAVVLGTKDAGGVLDGARPGSIIVIHSTVRPATCKRIAALAKDKGVRVVDAPVSGGAIGARARALLTIVAGDIDTIETCRPILESFSKTIIFTGDVGSAQVAKLANNLATFVNLEGVRESLRLARAGGISEQAMIEVLKAGSANSWRVQNWEAHKKVISQYTNGPDGVGKVRHKDITLALEEGYALNVSLPVTALVSQFTSRTEND